MRNTERSKKGFTLVELIIVIVILAILSGVAIVSYTSNLSGARDSARTADMAQLKISLKTEKQKSGTYPLPGDAFPIVNSGTSNPVARQGFMNSKVATNEISKYPTDPVALKPYTYSTTKNRQAFQIAMTLEEGDGRALVDGDYKSVSMNVLPSLVLAIAASTGSSVEIADGVVTAGSDGSANRKKFVVNGGTANLPYGKDGAPVANSTLPFGQILTQSGVVLTGSPGYRSCQQIIDAGAWIGAGEYQLLATDGTMQDITCKEDGSLVHKSCKTIKAMIPSAIDGTYQIDADGIGPFAPISAYCDMTTDGGGYTMYPIAGGAQTCKYTDADSCKAIGLNLAVPRTKAHWLSMVGKYGGWYFNIMPGIYSTVGGKNYAGLGCVMRDPVKYGSGCPDWRAIDGGTWWIRDTPFSEPNGDYTAGYWIGGYGVSTATIEAGQGFNDLINGYCATSYVCSTNDK